MTKLVIGLCLLALQSFAFAKPLEERTGETPEMIGELFAIALQDQDYKAVDERFDRAQFAEKIIRHMNARGADAEVIRKSVTESMSLQLILGTHLKGYETEDINVKTIGVVQKGNQLTPIVRLIIAESGANYYELSLQKKNGKYFIDDLFVITNAQFISETMAQTLAATLNQGNWVDNFNLDTAGRKEVTDIFAKMIQYRKDGDFAGVYTTLKKLPEKILAFDAIHLVVVMAAAQLDEKIYRTELSAFAKRHGNNPRYTFMLIDHYIFTKEYDKALKNVDTLLQRYHNDAALMLVKGAIYMEMNDHQKALQTAQTAIEFEPDYEDAYWTGVTLSLNQKNYEAAITWLKAYEQQFDYDFATENFQDQDLYKGFIKSRAFKRWMKAKQ